jgi:hypothetical protein
MTQTTIKLYKVYMISPQAQRHDCQTQVANDFTSHVTLAFSNNN